jgi:hypothetical protein
LAQRPEKQAGFRTGAKEKHGGLNKPGTFDACGTTGIGFTPDAGATAYSGFYICKRRRSWQRVPLHH